MTPAHAAAEELVLNSEDVTLYEKVEGPWTTVAAGDISEFPALVPVLTVQPGLSDSAAAKSAAASDEEQTTAQVTDEEQVACEATGDVANAKQLDPIHAPTPNRILGHVVYRLHTTLEPPPSPPPLPPLPVARVRAAVVGKAFSGSSAAVATACEKLGISVISPTKLIEEAMLAATNGETEVQFCEANGLPPPATPAEPIVDAYPELTPTHPSVVGMFASALPVPPTPKPPPLSKNAIVGARLTEQVASGEAADPGDVIELIIQAIQLVDSTKGWVVDGFPSTAEEARLLEKRAVGYVVVFRLVVLVVFPPTHFPHWTVIDTMKTFPIPMRACRHSRRLQRMSNDALP